MKPNLTFGPIDSVAQYLLYLSIVVLGVLLPFLLNKWKSRRDEQRLIDRTLKALRDEVETNRRRVLTSLESFVVARDEAERLREAYGALRSQVQAGAGGGVAPTSKNFDLSLALTTRVGWDVARLSHALPLIAPEQLVGFTRAYQLQELWERDRSLLLQTVMHGETIDLPADLGSTAVLDQRLVNLTQMCSVLRYHVGLAEAFVKACDLVLANA